MPGILGEPPGPMLQIDPNAQGMHAGPGILGRAVPAYEMTGAQVGKLYHGSNQKLQSIDPARLQSRDYGFYGSGFYGTTTPQYAKSYGRSVTQFSLADDARILNASLKPEDAPSGLFDAVRQHIMAASLPAAFMRGKSDQAIDELSGIGDSPISWKNAVDSFATKNGYDAVRYSDGEIVIKNPAAINLSGDK